jgi:hypothetical protein
VFSHRGSDHRFGFSRPVFIQPHRRHTSSIRFRPRTTCRHAKSSNEKPTWIRASASRPTTPVAVCTVYIHTQEDPPHTLSRCISNRRPAHRLRNRYRSVSRLARCLLPLDLSAVTTPWTRSQVVALRVPIHHGRQDHHLGIATRPHPTSRTRISSARTLTTRTSVPSSPRHQHRPVSLLWLRRFRYCHHCTRKRSPRPSDGAAVARSSEGPRSP